MPVHLKDLERAAAAGDLSFVQLHGRRFAHKLSCYALHEACKHGHHQIVRELLVQGYSPCVLRQEGYWKRSPLQHACEAGHLLAVQELLKCEETDPNQQTNELVNDTALHLASAAGFASIVAELVAAGANVDVLNSSGESPLLVAVREGKEEAVLVLCTLKASCRLVLHTAVHYKQVTILKLFLAHVEEWGIDINEVNSDKQTALRLACELGDSQGALLLLRAGASLAGLEKVKQNNSIGVRLICPAVAVAASYRKASSAINCCSAGFECSRQLDICCYQSGAKAGEAACSGAW